MHQIKTVFENNYIYIYTYIYNNLIIQRFIHEGIIISQFYYSHTHIPYSLSELCINVNGNSFYAGGFDAPQEMQISSQISKSYYDAWFF